MKEQKNSKISSKWLNIFWYKKEKDVNNGLGSENSK